MLDVELNEAIIKFVRRFRVVRRRHLDRFFREWDVGTYKHSMKCLLEDHVLHEQDKDVYSLVYPGKLPMALRDYEGVLRCLDMLTGTLKNSEVLWCDSADFPLEMRFQTIADELYDVAYMDERNWANKWGLLPLAWKRCVPPGEEDPINHIAVVSSVEMAQKLRDMAFSQFVVVDHNGAVLGIYDNE